MANKIYIQIEADSKGAEENVDALNKGIANIGDSSEKATAKATSGIKSVSVGIEQATNSVNSLVASLTGLGVAALTREWLGFGDAMTRANFALDRAFGPQTASDIGSQIRSIAHEAGMARESLMATATQLAAVFKVPEDRVTQWINVFTNIARQSAKGEETVEGLANAMGAAWSKGYITAREAAMKLTALGVPAMKILEEAYKVNQVELKKMLTGQQDVKASIGELMDAMERQSRGAAAAYVKAVPSAQLAQAFDELKGVALETFRSMQPAIEDAIKVMSRFVGLLAMAVDAFHNLDPVVQDTIRRLAYLAIALAALGTTVTIVSALMTGFGGVLTVLGTVAGVTTKAIAALDVAFGALSAELLGLTAGLAAFLGVSEAVAAAIVTLTAAILGFVAWEAFGDKIKQWFGGIIDWIKEVWDKAGEYMKKAYDAIKAYVSEKTGGPPAIDVDLLKRQAQEMDDALAEARARMKRNEDQQISSLIDKYAKLETSLKGNAQQLARLPELYATAEQAILNSMMKQVETDTRKAELEVNRLRRQTDIIAGEIPQTGTFEQQREQAERARNDRMTQATEDAALQIGLLDKRYRAEIQGVDDVAAHRRQIGQDSAAARAEDARKIASLRMMWDQEVANEQDKLGAQYAKAEMERNKEVHKADFEDWKQTQEERVAYLEQQAQSAAAIRRARIEAAPAQTEQARLQQIGNLRDAEIDAIKAVSKIREDDLNAQTSRRIEEAGSNAKEILEILDDTRKKQNALTLQSVTDQKLAYINAWKEANQVVIEQQRAVFENLQTAIGDIFDAFVDKSKSVWSAIGNLIKSTLLNAIKSVITSQVAASLTQMLGYGPVQVQRKGLWGMQPVFSGLGTLPEFGIGTASSGITGFPSPQSTTTAPSASSPVESAQREVRGDINQIVSDAAQEQWRAQTGVAPYAGGGAEVQGIAGPTGIYVGGSGGGYGGYRGGADITAGGGTVVTGRDGAGGGGFAGSIQSMRDSLNIGKPVYVPGDGVTTLGQWKPWSQATAAQKLGSIVKSQGFATMATSIGVPMLLGSLSQKGPKAAAMGIIGGAAAGYGLATMFGASWMGPSGLLAGAGIGLFAAGYKARGIGGLAMTTLGGTLAGAGIGNMIVPGVGAVVGAAIGAGVGLATGVVNLFRKSQTQQIRDLVRQVYGIDIPDQGVLQQISDIADQKYGGSIHRAVYGSDVQDLIRLYGLSTGQRLGALPRPMYSATYNQSASGGLQLQPVYSGGRVVANPYTGTTTTQLANWNTMSQNLPAVFLQLNPQQAVSLFQGQVVQAIGANPGAVAAANTTAAQSGQGRQTQAGSLLEPATVMS
jgi:hypothetical protein